MLATLTNVLVIHNTVPANSVAELISLAKAKPGAINFGSGGTGGVTHLAGELFKYMTQVNIVHVPYKGGAPAMNDLVGGQVQMMLLNMLNSLPHVRAGRLKGLAVTSLQRSRYAP
jgi:tripartite-type tricarboxylate transporter receptor subunit TctC